MFPYAFLGSLGPVPESLGPWRASFSSSEDDTPEGSASGSAMDDDAMTAALMPSMPTGGIEGAGCTPSQIDNI